MLPHGDVSYFDRGICRVSSRSLHRHPGEPPLLRAHTVRHASGCTIFSGDYCRSFGEPDPIAPQGRSAKPDAQGKSDLVINRRPWMTRPQWSTRTPLFSGIFAFKRYVSSLFVGRGKGLTTPMNAATAIASQIRSCLRSDQVLVSPHYRGTRAHREPNPQGTASARATAWQSLSCRLATPLVPRHSAEHARKTQAGRRRLHHGPAPVLAL